MTEPLTIYVNDQPVYDHDRDTVLDDRQEAFLDRMDLDMNRGVKMNGVLHEHPDARQRQTFVAMNLLNALRQDNPAKIAVACAYLTQRRPQLREVRAYDHEQGVMVELVDQQDA